MTIASWSPQLSVGVDALDEDHQRLIDTMNDVFDGLLQGTSASATRPALSKLRRYVEEHFAREEAWMLENGSANYEQHQAEHQALRHQVDRLLNMHEQTDDQVAVELLVVLRDWLLRHIAGRDRSAAVLRGPAAP